LYPNSRHAKRALAPNLLRCKNATRPQHQDNNQTACESNNQPDCKSNSNLSTNRTDCKRNSKRYLSNNQTSSYQSSNQNNRRGNNSEQHVLDKPTATRPKVMRGLT
jgi:hypothetical protein